MTLKWIRGNFETGAISENNVLPVVDGSDKVTVDINAGDSGVLSMSKRGLGSSWMNIVVEGATLFALVDDSKPWNSASAVQFAGWVNKIDGRIGDVVTVQIVGLREYLAARIVSPLGKGGTTSPKAGVKFEADTWQGVASAIIQNAFSPVAGASSPPSVLGDVSGVISGTSKQRGVRLGDNEKYSDVLDEIRDSLSLKGLEYRFVPRWKSAAKNAIVWDAVIASDTDGQINWSGEPIPINLSQEQFKHLSFRLSASSEGIANRLIIQSKAGDDETDTGADYTVISVSNGLPLFDTFHNPGQELEQAELLERGTAIIQDLKTPKGSAAYEVADVPENWLPLLGRKLVFTSGNDIDAAGYNITVRCTGMSFTGSDSERSMVAIDVMLPQARYPRLPSSKSKSNGDTMIGGGGGNGSGSSPVTGGHLPGNWSPPGPIEFDDLEPPYIPEPIDEQGFSKIAAGAYGALAISKTGELFSWGYSAYGELGYFMYDDEGNYIEHLNPEQVGTLNNWDRIYTSMSQETYGITKEGSLYTWGSNASGALGREDITQSSQPWLVLEDVRDIFFANSYAWVIKKDGTLWAAGNNINGVLGLPIAQKYTTFTQVGEKSNWEKLSSNGGNPVTTTVIALDSDGVLYWWNGGSYSEGATTSGPQLWPDNEILFKDVVIVQNGYNNNDRRLSSFFIGHGVDNKLYTWGTGSHSDSGFSTQRIIPELYDGELQDIHALFPRTYIDSGGLADLWAPFVIKADGELWVLGNNAIGVVPIQPYKLDIDYDFRQEFYSFMNNYAVAVITTDGELFVGGRNSQGGLGLGSVQYNMVEPFDRVGDSTGWIRVAFGQYADFGFAVRGTDMYASGLNSSGELGIGNTDRTTSWTIQPTSK